MKNKILIIIIAILLATAYVARILYVNSNTLAPKIVEYKVGDEVPIEDDFFDNSSEKMKGYSITVTDTLVLSIDEFKEKYGEYKNESKAEYVYLIKATFKNTDNSLGEGAGINLGQYILQNDSYINFIDREAYIMTNEIDSLMFSLRENSEMDFIIPFNINPMYIDIKQIKSGNPTLVVSLYPHKKIIELND